MKMKPIPYLLTIAALGLMACGCGDKPAGQAPQPGEEATASTAAERIDDQGRVTYRPDTARVFYDGQVDLDKAFIVISKRDLRLSVYADIGGDTTLVARYPVCMSRNKGQKTRSGDMKTPESEPGKPFTIEQIQDASTWVHDFGDGRGSIAAYGHWFMRLTTPFSGVGIHGSTGNEDKMPGRDSEGCIRLRDADLDHLHDHYARVGMAVTIKGEDQGDLPFEASARKGQGHTLPMP